jgi:hypothetical protein
LSNVYEKRTVFFIEKELILFFPLKHQLSTWEGGKGYRLLKKKMGDGSKSLTYTAKTPHI